MLMHIVQQEEEIVIIVEMNVGQVIEEVLIQKDKMIQLVLE